MHLICVSFRKLITKVNKPISKIFQRLMGFPSKWIGLYKQTLKIIPIERMDRRNWQCFAPFLDVTSKHKGQNYTSCIFIMHFIINKKLKKLTCMFKHIYSTLTIKLIMWQVNKYFRGTKILRLNNNNKKNLGINVCGRAI